MFPEITATLLMDEEEKLAITNNGSSFSQLIITQILFQLFLLSIPQMLENLAAPLANLMELEESVGNKKSVAGAVDTIIAIPIRVLLLVSY